MGSRPDGEEAPRSSCTFSPTPPLCFDGDTCRTVVELARYEQPLRVTSSTLGGLTGPATACGLIVLQHA